MGLEIYPRTPRLVNRFSLGSDPEFVFHTSKGVYTYAQSLGLTTSRAFGADMAGRQAEIRAYPSKFALRVVASVIDSLRWMAYVHRYDADALNWIAIAFNGNDGCGGHIHLGRRRPNRVNDVAILDTTLKILLDLGVFDKAKFQERQRTKHYGKYGDIRPQSHGYEYRTPPTQMASPWLMYFTLVVNKLLVYQGNLRATSGFNTEGQIVNLLTAYKDRDDDAAIALEALKKWGLPKEDTTDFRPRWGVPTWIGQCYSPENFDRLFFPSVIKPEETTCHELFEYLTEDKFIPRRTPEPTWEPYTLPKGFYNLMAQLHTLGHLPDLVKDLISKGRGVQVNVGDYFAIYHDVPLPGLKIKQALQGCVDDIKMYPQKSGGIQIYIPQAFNKSLEQCKKLHEVLGNTELFPVCKAQDYKSVDWSRWDQVAIQTPKVLLGKFKERIEGKPLEAPKPVAPVARKRPLYHCDVENGGDF